MAGALEESNFLEQLKKERKKCICRFCILCRKIEKNLEENCPTCYYPNTDKKNCENICHDK